MRLSEIQMEGFRGYPACCPLKLDYDVVIIFGDNGSGKSSLFNAIEWLLEDTVDLGDCRDANAGDRFRNLFTDCEQPWVRLTFSERRASRTCHYQVIRRLKAGTVQASRVERKEELLQPESFPDRLLSRKTLDEQDIPYDWPLRYGEGEFEQVFLNRKRLGRFVEVKASDRGEQLFKLLGYGVLDEHHHTIDRLLAFLRECKREKGLEKAFGDSSAILLDKVNDFSAEGGALPEDVRMLTSVLQELIQETSEEIEEEYPASLEGLIDLLQEEIQQVRDSHNLTLTQRELAEEKLEDARTVLNNQQEFSDFFQTEQWIDPDNYEVLDIGVRTEAKQQLLDLPEMLDRVSEFRDDPTMFDLEARLSFLEYGLGLVREQDYDTCPFCLQDITGQWDETQTVRMHFTSKHQAFLEKYQLLDPKNNLMEDLEGVCDSLQAIVDCEGLLTRNHTNLGNLFSSYEPKARDLGAETSSLDLEVISESEVDFSPTLNLLCHLRLAVDFLKAPEDVQFSIPDDLLHQIECTEKQLQRLKEMGEATEEIVDDLNTRYLAARQAFRNRMLDGLEEEVGKWQDRLQAFALLDDLQDLEDEASSLEESAAKLSVMNEYIRLLLDVREMLQEVEGSLMKEALERVSSRVNEIYGRMNPDEALNCIVFKPAGGRRVDLIMDDKIVDLSDKEPKPPAFLSEGHLNCLGIAIHLALQEVIDSSFDFVAFDDPLYSIDAGHRRRAVDEVFSVAKQAGKQLFIATHDPLFFHYLKQKLKLRHEDFESQQVYIVVNHSSTEPDIVVEGSPKTFLQAARERLHEGCDSYALESVYVLMRREIEYLCDSLLEGQRVAVYGQEYNLDSRIELLRELQGIDEADISKLHEARLICNPAAHHDPQRESYTVAYQVMRDIGSFRDKYLLCPDERC